MVMYYYHYNNILQYAVAMTHLRRPELFFFDDFSGRFVGENPAGDTKRQFESIRRFRRVHQCDRQQWNVGEILFGRHPHRTTTFHFRQRNQRLSSSEK